LQIFKITSNYDKIKIYLNYGTKIVEEFRLLFPPINACGTRKIICLIVLCGHKLENKIKSEKHLNAWRYQLYNYKHLTIG